MKLLGSIFAARRALKDLSRIAAAQEAQARLLARIAQVVAPEQRDATDEDLRTTSVSPTLDQDFARQEETIETFYLRNRRLPTADELVTLLDGPEI